MVVIIIAYKYSMVVFQFKIFLMFMSFVHICLISIALNPRAFRILFQTCGMHMHLKAIHELKEKILKYFHINCHNVVI